MPLFGTYRRVVNVSAAAVVAGDYRANNDAIVFCDEASVGIAPQESFDAVARVVHGIQTHARAGKPQRVDGFVIFDFHFSDFHFDSSSVKSTMQKKKQGVAKFPPILNSRERTFKIVACVLASTK